MNHSSPGSLTLKRALHRQDEHDHPQHGRRDHDRLLALHVTSATEGDRAQVAQLAQAVQAVTGQTVKVGFVDQGYTGDDVARDAAQYGIELKVVKLPPAKKGFVLLPRRWVVERSFAWTARFRRLARDYERLPQTLAGLHFLAFAMLRLPRFVSSLAHLL